MTTETLYDRGIPTSYGFRDVTPADVAGSRGAVRLVDVRQPDEFTGELGHVPGATLVPLGSLPEAAQTWDREAPIVVICRSGGRSTTAAAKLVIAGFRRVMNMNGGMMAYNARGLPTER